MVLQKAMVLPFLSRPCLRCLLELLLALIFLIYMRISPVRRTLVMRADLFEDIGKFKE